MTKPRIKTIHMPVSRIRSAWLRRLVILGTYPFMALGNVLSLAWGVLKVVAFNAVTFPISIAIVAINMQLNLFDGAREQWKN